MFVGQATTTAKALFQPGLSIQLQLQRLGIAMETNGVRANGDQHTGERGGSNPTDYFHKG